MGNDFNAAMSGRAPLAETAAFATAKVASNVLLDSRLALYHETAGWLAVADLHYGYELNRRRDGGLYPLWGMQCVADRLEELLNHYHPTRLILLGDIMDGRGSVEETLLLVARLRDRTEVVCIMGNHDSPALKRAPDMVECHAEAGYFFHHGHRMEDWRCPKAAPGTHVTGHLHPAYVFADGAGLRLKLPAFVQTHLSDEQGSAAHWVMPAFSPWASGCCLTAPSATTQLYAVHRKRILKV